MFTPTFLIENSMTLSKIRELAVQFSNDEQFGEKVRAYLKDVSDGKVYKNSTMEMDKPTCNCPFCGEKNEGTALVSQYKCISCGESFAN